MPLVQSIPRYSNNSATAAKVNVVMPGLKLWPSVDLFNKKMYVSKVIE
jgi:hypothetical protein